MIEYGLLERILKLCTKTKVLENIIVFALYWDGPTFLSIPPQKLLKNIFDSPAELSYILESADLLCL